MNIIKKISFILFMSYFACTFCFVTQVLAHDLNDDKLSIADAIHTLSVLAGFETSMNDSINTVNTFLDKAKDSGFISSGTPKVIIEKNPSLITYSDEKIIMSSWQLLSEESKQFFNELGDHSSDGKSIYQKLFNWFFIPHVLTFFIEEELNIDDSCYHSEKTANDLAVAFWMSTENDQQRLLDLIAMLHPVFNQLQDPTPENQNIETYYNKNCFTFEHNPQEFFYYQVKMVLDAYENRTNLNFDVIVNHLLQNEKPRGFTTISNEKWGETAVRKVLHTFAYGGFATDEQIKAWAEMNPENAIVEIISFDTNNLKLSKPADSDVSNYTLGTLSSMMELWSSNSPDNPVKNDERERYSINSWSAPEKIWITSATTRGLNPVRQKMGLWETNYHMSINQDAGVNNRQIIRYYDDIMNALNSDIAYQNVLAIAAKSAGVATQYNHKDSLFIDSKFRGNEDFAREFHQLFFCILGDYDPEYHEYTTIRNTAKSLTHMTVKKVEDGNNDSYYSDEVEFGVKYHYPASLEVLNTMIEGQNAKEKIEKLAQVAINHPESLKNLPIVIIRGLADDNLNEYKYKIIRQAWEMMETKSLLQFLRKYAISTIFHDESRIKYWSSFDRNIMMANLVSLSNSESYSEFYSPATGFYYEGVRVFRPMHDVFGGQTGLEASDTADVFKNVYNRIVNQPWTFSKTQEKIGEKVVWEKDWGKVVPSDPDGIYRVKSVGEWLWNRFVADGLKNFGSLEKAHVFALIGSGKDLAYFINPNNPLFVYTSQLLESDRSLKEIIHDLTISPVCLKQTDVCYAEDVEEANFRIGMAINFIAATPYMFLQEGE